MTYILGPIFVTHSTAFKTVCWLNIMTVVLVIIQGFCPFLKHHFIFFILYITCAMRTLFILPCIFLKILKMTNGHWIHLSVKKCVLLLCCTRIKSCIRNVISYSLLMVLFQWHGSVLFNNKWHCQPVLLILCFYKSFVFTLEKKLKYR